jgi:hypothetical protein
LGCPLSDFPIIALISNIIVVSGNFFNYIGAGNINLKLLVLVTSELVIFVALRMGFKLFI